jgi:hypothetical protein
MIILFTPFVSVSVEWICPNVFEMDHNCYYLLVSGPKMEESQQGAYLTVWIAVYF